jgi:putative membrane protein
MKPVLIVTAAVGLVLAVAIIVSQGIGAVVQAFAAVGVIGLAAITLVRAVELIGAGLGWWIVFPPEAKASLGAAVWIRFIREAINMLLPVAQVGGEIAGARVMTFFGIGAGLAGASVLVDILMQVVSLLLFAVVGAVVLAAAGASDAVLWPIVAGIALMSTALFGFFLAQRFGGAKLVDRGLMAMAARLGWSSLANLASLHDNLMRIYANLPRFALAMLVHIGVWFVGALEVFFPLYLMGFPVTFADAVVIESLGQVVRAAAFLVPGALGVQEAGFIAICAVFGIPAPAALAMSLVKRVPELVLGPPFLFAWHVHETRALDRRARTSSPASNRAPS